MHKAYPYSLIQFYVTVPYPCPYLGERMARSQVAMPKYQMDAYLYDELVQVGFRRSGVYTYRPYCDQCKACVPVRIPVADFVPDRSQRRAWKKHGNLLAARLPLEFNEEHYLLYNRYQNARHAGGGMDQDNEEQYIQFLLQSEVDSFLIEFREGPVLRMVSIIDRLSDGISSVYTFYDPDIADASFGTYGILWQINACQRRGLPYVYLGYWIDECRKMGYKRRYRPLEGYTDGRWEPLAAL